MPTIYITDKTRQMLDQLVKAEKRNIADETEFICENRIKELGLPADMTLPSSEGNNDINPTQESQEVSGESVNV